MYDTRWPRPGPAMAAVAAVLGLVAGIVLGLSSPGTAPQAQASAAQLAAQNEAKAAQAQIKLLTAELAKAKGLAEQLAGHADRVAERRPSGRRRARRGWRGCGRCGGALSWRD